MQRQNGHVGSVTERTKIVEMFESEGNAAAWMQVHLRVGRQGRRRRARDERGPREKKRRLR